MSSAPMLGDLLEASVHWQDHVNPSAVPWGKSEVFCRLFLYEPRWVLTEEIGHILRKSPLWCTAGEGEEQPR